ncbi:uncharacterized protein LOC124280775 [Haliotis rubra]|uniref:uncharacterized protein LOC124280775 n=1 Tax=Haliotis rubra TaxID=36100 RepID=UPI001EE5DA8B|nr:uncharacterized protein LOC124280775 [Haliotis rubra]
MKSHEFACPPTHYFRFRLSTHGFVCQHMIRVNKVYCEHCNQYVSRKTAYNHKRWLTNNDKASAPSLIDQNKEEVPDLVFCPTMLFNNEFYTSEGYGQCSTPDIIMDR